MSPIGIASSLFSLFQSAGTRADSKPAEAAAGGGDFASSLALRMASSKAESLNVLIGSAFNRGKSDAAPGSDLATLLGSAGSATGLAASGRNTSLFDPESGFRMMSVINKKDVTYKAQFAELSAMSDAVVAMQQAAQALDDADAAQDNATIAATVSTFVDSYNAWVRRFNPSVEANGVLDGTQAAEVSLYELEQSVQNIFNGAKDGFRGIRDIGVTIDPASKLAVFDAAKLEQALAGNRAGAVATIDQFAANFARSAELLNSANNFIPNRLANLDRVIDYIDANTPSLQREFGSGEAAKASGEFARALEAYQRMAKA